MIAVSVSQNSSRFMIPSRRKGLIRAEANRLRALATQSNPESIAPLPGSRAITILFSELARTLSRRTASPKNPTKTPIAPLSVQPGSLSRRLLDRRRGRRHPPLHARDQRDFLVRLHVHHSQIVDEHLRVHPGRGRAQSSET